MRIIRLLPLLLLVSGLAWAQEQYTLRYAPAVGSRAKMTLDARVVEAVVQGQPIGVSGQAKADLELLIKSVNEQDRSVNGQFILTNLRADLNGQPSEPRNPEPVDVVIDEFGRMKLPEADEAAGANLMDTGGIPIQLVSLLALMVRLPQQPVTVGQEWQYQDTYTLPDMGEVPINTRWKLMQVEDGVATIGATAAAVVPDFKVPNPMAPGTDMDVRGATVTVGPIVQQYRLEDSRVIESESTLRINARLDMGGFEMPLVMGIKSKMEPAEDAENAGN